MAAPTRNVQIPVTPAEYADLEVVAEGNGCTVGELVYRVGVETILRAYREALTAATGLPAAPRPC